MPRLVRAVDPPDADRRHAHGTSPAAGEDTGNRDAAAPAVPGSSREPDSIGRSLVIAVARDPLGAALATTALTGPDLYQMTASLIAWGAIHTAAPDATRPTGVHGPVAAFGLDTLRHGAAESGLHEIGDPPR